MTERTHRGNHARSGAAALASSIAPGWGQILVGRGNVGRVLLVIDGVLVVVLVVLVLFFRIELLQAWVTPTALLGILAVNLGVLLYRGVAAIDSFVSAGGRGAWDWFAGVVAGVIVLAPHLLLGSLVLTQYDLIDTVFGGGQPTAAAPVTTTAIDPGPTTTVMGLTSTTLVPTTSTTAPTIWDGQERLNILLLGSDAGEGRIGTRTDTMILVSIDPESGNVAMFSIPRNLTFAPLPEGMGLWDCNCFPDILAHLWANGEWYPDAFPGPLEPPVNALKGAVGLIFDVDVHYYAKVDLKGFVDVVDALGGVTIDIPERIADPTYPHEDGGTESLVFEPGVQLLDGHHALAYGRIRRNSGDFARMHRQRCLLGALVRQTGPLDVISGFEELASAVKENVVTDIPVEALPDFVELLPKVHTSRVASLRITRYNYGVGGNNPGTQRYDLDQLRMDARLLMEDPEAALATLDGDGLDATCEESFD
ncbi:MAG TPA: LCP family protein [Acidimicrobiia bacterium]|nr:LCP family protein [Acidimicrobiia bacterium]